MSTVGMRALGLTSGPVVTDEAVAAAAEVIGTVLFHEPGEAARADAENLQLARRILEAAAAPGISGPPDQTGEPE